MSAAAQARRRDPGMEIVALEAGAHTSYSACGIPYLVGGSIEGVDTLVARTPEEFRAARIDVRVDHEVRSVDLDSRSVEVWSSSRERSFRLGFDLLHIATGASPRRPEVPGADGPHVHGVQTLADAETLLADAAALRPEHVVVVGSGYVGLELAEAFLDRGATVSVLERGPEVMHGLDPDMGALVSRALRAAGVSVRTGEDLLEIDDGKVRTSRGDLPADLVVLGTGVVPNSALAEAAGIELGVAGAIVVDRRQSTSAEGVWAAGDCCQSLHLVSGRPVHEALGTVANRQGRVAGVNIAGGYAAFPGVVGTAATRVCSTEVARTGLGEAQAAEAGFETASATVSATTAAGYMPGAARLSFKLVAESGTGRVLGAQVVGGPGSARRIDVVATAIAAGMTAGDVVDLDLAYTPTLGSVWEPVQIAARRILAGSS